MHRQLEEKDLKRKISSLMNVAPEKHKSKNAFDKYLKLSRSIQILTPYLSLHISITTHVKITIENLPPPNTLLMIHYDPNYPSLPTQACVQVGTSGRAEMYFLPPEYISYLYFRVCMRIVPMIHIQSVNSGRT